MSKGKVRRFKILPGEVDALLHRKLMMMIDAAFAAVGYKYKGLSKRAFRQTVLLGAGISDAVQFDGQTLLLPRSLSKEELTYGTLREIFFKVHSHIIEQWWEELPSDYLKFA